MRWRRPSRRWANPDLSGGAVTSGRRAVEAATPAQRDEMRDALGIPIAAEMIPAPESLDAVEALCRIIRMMRGAKNVMPEVVDAWLNSVTSGARDIGNGASATVDHVEQGRQANRRREAALRNLTGRELTLMANHQQKEE